MAVENFVTIADAEVDGSQPLKVTTMQSMQGNQDWMKLLTTSNINGGKVSPGATQASQILIEAGQALDGTGVTAYSWAEHTIDITTSGIQGLDTGAEASDTWYAVHILGDSTNVATSLGVFSLSATSPTLPAAYDVCRFLGWVRNDSSSNFLEFTSDPFHRHMWEEDRSNLLVLNGGTATSFTAVDLSSLVPPNAPGVYIRTMFDSNNAGANAEIRDSGSSLTDPPIHIQNGVGTTGNNAGSTIFQMVLGDTKEIEYMVNTGSSNLTIYVMGYIDKL